MSIEAMRQRMAHGGWHGAGGARARWPEILFLLWVVALLAAPAVLVDYDGAVPKRFVDPAAHAGLELFCGITAFLIAGLLGALSHQYRQLSLAVFAVAFAVMGTLDVVHAVTLPHRQPELFVLLHTLSAVTGGVLLAAGVGVALYTAPAGERRVLLPRFLGLSGLVLVVGLGYLLLLPSWHAHQGDAFPQLTLRAHELAGALYAVAAVGSFVYYRAHRRPLALVVAAMLLLFAESAYLFRYSYLWDAAWWSWHVVKMMFYLGILVVITGGVVVALRAVERSRTLLSFANQELIQAHAAEERLNRDLQVRNRMVTAAISCATLEGALRAAAQALSKYLSVARYELLLRVPADEVDEVQRGLARQNLDWQVRAVPQEVRGPVALTSESCVPLVLRANDKEFAELRPHVHKPAQATQHAAALESLAAEIGPMVHNALLYQQWADAVRFRSALLRISSLLGSTLELEHVLHGVCRESADLLDSDGVLVFLRDAQQRYALASQCLCAQGAADPAPQAGPWDETQAGRRVLRALQRTRRPAALLRAPHEPAEPRFVAGSCDWGAAAVFPLLDEEALIGVMVLLRKARVQYSNATLEKGMLLAERVQNATNNARSFRALQDANAQLRAAQEDKLRAERLAALGQVAATVAHEVRNPLGAIENCTAVLRSGASGNSAALSALEIVEDEVRRLDRLTRNLLNFGKPRTEHYGLHRPGRLLRNVADGVRRHLAQEGMHVELVERALNGDQPVIVDGDGLHEVLWNLMLNAAQAMRGKGRVVVDVRVRADAVFVAVADNGPGIAPARRAHVMEPFYSQRPQGAGLGLAIVRQLVTAWHGRMRIFGDEGRGTCFALRIPHAGVEVAAHAIAQRGGQS